MHNSMQSGDIIQLDGTLKTAAAKYYRCSLPRDVQQASTVSGQLQCQHKGMIATMT